MIRGARPCERTLVSWAGTTRGPTTDDGYQPPDHTGSGCAGKSDW